MSTGLKIVRCVLPCANTPKDRLQTSDMVTNVYAMHMAKRNWCLEAVMQRGLSQQSKLTLIILSVCM